MKKIFESIYNMAEAARLEEISLKRNINGEVVNSCDPEDLATLYLLYVDGNCVTKSPILAKDVKRQAAQIHDQNPDAVITARAKGKNPVQLYPNAA